MSLTVDNLLDIYNRFVTNVDLCRRMDRKLFTCKKRESWKRSYEKRSQAYRKAYSESKYVMETYKDFFTDGFPEDEVVDTIRDLIISLDESVYDDPFFFIRLIDSLIEHYKEKDDTVSLIKLYDRQGWEIVNCVRMGYETDSDAPLQSFLNVLNYKDNYVDYSDDVRTLFFKAYFNIVCVLPELRNTESEADYRYMREAISFFNSNLVNDLGITEDEHYYIELTERRWIALDLDFDLLDEEEITLYRETAHRLYNREMAIHDGNEMKVSAEAVIAHWRCLVQEESVAYMAALKHLLKYYYKRRSSVKFSSDDLFVMDSEYYFADKMPDILIFQWLNNDKVPEDFRKVERKKLILSKCRCFSNATGKLYSPALNLSLSNWCFGILKYLDTLEEKEYVIFHLVITRQVSTFFHSYMVAEIADMFTDTILNKEPELFIGMNGMKTVEEILQNRDMIRKFVHNCALFHDIGKNRMTDVVNMQHRGLLPKERDIIRMHPEVGAKLVEDEHLYIYRDAILGHHKSFDGTFGYPESFDNVASPIKPVIDIISIADSLDAGTDHLGRNYAVIKSFETVLDELVEGSQSRYNGSLVKLVVDNDNLYFGLQMLLSNDREDCYYNMFTEHFDKKYSDFIVEAS